MADQTAPAIDKAKNDEERHRRYAELTRRASLSPIYARHRDPAMYVRWVRDDKYDIATHKHMLFEFAKDSPKTPEPQRRINTVVPVSDDGLYRTGDVILMEIKRDDYEFYLNENVKRSKLMVNSGKDSFKNDAKRLKVPTFDRDSGGHPQFHDE